MSFMISRDGTIVQAGGVLEPDAFYDFQGWNHCPGGRCDGTPLSQPDGILQVGNSGYQSTFLKKRNYEVISKERLPHTDLKENFLVCDFELSLLFLVVLSKLS